MNYTALIRPIIFLSVLFISIPGMAEEKSPQPDKLDPQGMNNKQLGVLIKRLDENVKGQPGYWQFKIDEQLVYVITDEKADRMRIIAPITKVEVLKKEELFRLMQANFDSALDARYSIAKGVLWSAFIHPLSPLSDKEFLLGLGQVVNLVATYGTSYSSGALIFQGGDSRGLQRRELIDRLLKKGLVT